jgi:hypothetical protein
MGFDTSTGTSDPNTKNGNLVVNGQVDGSMQATAEPA